METYDTTNSVIKFVHQVWGAANYKYDDNVGGADSIRRLAVANSQLLYEVID